MIAVQNQHIQSYGLQIWQACSQGQFGHDPFKIFRKGGVARVTWPPKFLENKCYYLNTVKANAFKFGRHVLWNSPHMTLKFFEKEAWPGSSNPVNFWALNANCSKMAKDTDFKFDKHVAWNSPNMSPKNLSKMGVAMVMWPLKFWALDSNLRGLLHPSHAPFSKNF